MIWRKNYIKWDKKIILVRDVSDYLYTKYDKSASYFELYEHLKKKHKFKKEHGKKYGFDDDLAGAYLLITKKLIIKDDIDLLNRPDHTLDKYGMGESFIPAKMNEEALAFNKLYYEDLKEKTVELREKRNYKWALIGICVSVMLALIDISLSVYDIYWGKDHIYEKTTMHSDSMQIMQNKRIIELLEKQNSKKDSIIFQDEKRTYKKAR